MPQNFNAQRRKFLRLSVGGWVACTLMACDSSQNAKSLVPFEWQGDLLGTETSLVLYHEHEAAFQAAIKEIQAEMKRLAGIFTLYVHGSDLSRLNAGGSLHHAAPEILELIDVSRQLWRASDGLFDPTVQPLFDLYADYYKTPRAEDDPGPAEEAILEARRRVGLDKVLVSGDSIQFEMDGMVLGFNALVQGYLADRAAMFLKERGIRHGLINMGEYRAVGGWPGDDGSLRPWRVPIEDAVNRHTIFEEVAIMDGGVSTSMPKRSSFDARGSQRHLFDPKTGMRKHIYRSVTAVAPSAVLADGLSTVMALVEPDEAREILANFDEARALLRPLDGPPVRIGL